MGPSLDKVRAGQPWLSISVMVDQVTEPASKYPQDSGQKDTLGSQAGKRATTYTTMFQEQCTVQNLYSFLDFFTIIWAKSRKVKLLKVNPWELL